MLKRHRTPKVTSLHTLGSRNSFDVFAEVLLSAELVQHVAGLRYRKHWKFRSQTHSLRSLSEQRSDGNAGLFISLAKLAREPRELTTLRMYRLLHIFLLRCNLSGSPSNQKSLPHQQYLRARRSPHLLQPWQPLQLSLLQPR